MGTSGSGPFDSDGAADFLGELTGSPQRSVTKVLRAIARSPPGAYLDMDAGAPGWAAGELVALSFGRGDPASQDDAALEAAAKLKPNEELRLLAIETLRRLSDPKLSELAALWHEGADGPGFDARIAALRSRLEAAAAGPIELKRTQAGDVIVLRESADSACLVVVQVIGAHEVAVFSGVYADEAAALACLQGQSARRIVASPSHLARQGRTIGQAAIRKDLKGRKLYAGESGLLFGYIVATAAAGGARETTYAEASQYDRLRPYDESDVRAIALGLQAPERVTSPEQRERRYRANNAERWATVRELTTPGPFGDPESVTRVLAWFDERGMAVVLSALRDQATGRIGYVRPQEGPERRSYLLAGLVALWRGTLSASSWPQDLLNRLPPPPDQRALAAAVQDARILASRVITPDAELWLIWSDDVDKGSALVRCVADLQEALAE